MKAITIFNPISAILVGAVGAAIGAAFGKEGISWGIFVGGISGFVSPFYPIVLVMWIVKRIKSSRGHGQPERHDNN